MQASPKTEQEQECVSPGAFEMAARATVGMECFSFVSSTLSITKALISPQVV